MSLVDKLEIHVGDIVILKGHRCLAVGYVKNYSSKSVTLSLDCPFRRESGARKKIAMFGNGFEVFLKKRKYELEYFDSYQVLVKSDETWKLMYELIRDDE